MVSEMESFDGHRSEVHAPAGPASDVETSGPDCPVPFVHGADSSSYLWRHVIGLLDGQRGWDAVELALHGHTPV